VNSKQLIEKIIRGNKQATREFYKTYQSRLLNYILTRVQHPKDAEEILQDTFLSAIDALPLFKHNSSLYTWICAIAKHEICDFYRRKKIKTILFSRFPFLKRFVDKALSPELALQEKEVKQKIIHTFKNISEGYSQILRLKYIEGKTIKQIARILGKTAKAVDSKLYRARKAFQKEYGEVYVSTQSSKFKVQSSKKYWNLLTSSRNKRELSF
jgi:RNA polymerase sigma-70 factor (ECF subfamily)